MISERKISHAVMRFDHHRNFPQKLALEALPGAIVQVANVLELIFNKLMLVVVVPGLSDSGRAS